MRRALLLALLSVAHPALAQSPDGTERHADVAGSATITSKGISLIPTFTLGKPAAIFDLAIRNGNLSFEPQFRLALEGKPWSFIFWWRYRPPSGEKVHLGIGAHPAVVFRTMTVSTNGVQRELIVAARYLAGELSPSYSLASNLRVGAYYLYSYCLEQDAVKNTHFVALRVNLTNVKIADPYSVEIAPQLYYLRMDGREGVYFNSGLTLATRTMPLSISATVNKTIWTGIAAGEDFLWNLSLSYSMK
jgi:hypothetical protein